MTIEDLIAINIVLFLSMLSPGPAFLMIARQTLAEGFASGVKTGFGLGLVASFWTMTALIGLDRLFDLFPMIYSTAKAVGALVLIYFAFTMWRGATDQIAEKPVILKNPILLGMFTNAINPKSVLFASSVLLVVFPQGMPIFDNAVIVINHLMMEIVMYTILAYGLSQKAIGSGYQAAKLYLDRIFASLLAGLGIRLLMDR